jgi:Fe-S-cluster containining protein
MDCRIGCGACCIAPSISSAIPGMPQGKPAGVRCVQLDESNRCKIFGDASRPRVCVSLTAERGMCGHNRNDAIQLLTAMEIATRQQSNR